MKTPTTKLLPCSLSHHARRSVFIGQALLLVATISGCFGDPSAVADGGAETSPDASADHRSVDAATSDTTAHPADGGSALLAAAATCTEASQCASGFCADGVCCNAACTGSCQSCSLTGKLGTCSPVKNAQDDTCGGDATCDPSGTCRKGLGQACSGPTDCATGNCVDGVCCSSSVCGTCQSCAVAGSVGICAPVPKYTDDPDSSCSGTQTCNGLGQCQLKMGSQCGNAADCVSEQCTDGVCCESACAGTCYSCNQKGSEGTCKAIDGDVDPWATVTCTGSSICTAPNGAAPSCKLRDGQSCTSNDQCLNGSCLLSYLDSDGDGYGSTSVHRCELARQPGYIAVGGDCCDSDPQAHPGVTAYSQTTDACGSFDWNCNGVVEKSSTSGTAAMACGCVGGGKLGEVCTLCR
jgi:hypothetical protein